MILYTAKYNIPFQIDEVDHEAVSYYTWGLSGFGNYVATQVRNYDGSPRRQRTISLHWFLLGVPPAGLEWDHRNQDKLDNRRENFRLVTRTVQTRNSPIQINNTSGIRGVHQIPNGKWLVRIGTGHHDARIVIGRFSTIQEAADARIRAEKQFWGTER